MLNKTLCKKCYKSNRCQHNKEEVCAVPLLWNMTDTPFKKPKPNSKFAKAFPHLSSFDPKTSIPPAWCPYLLEHTVNGN